MIRRPGEYDEDSFWYKFMTPPALRMEHQMIKTREAVAGAASYQASAFEASMGAAVRIEQLTAHVAHLEQQLMATALYSRTILQLLLDKGLLTPEEFAQRLDQIDLLDGRRDSR